MAAIQPRRSPTQRALGVVDRPVVRPLPGPVEERRPPAVEDPGPPVDAVAEAPEPFAEGRVREVLLDDEFRVLVDEAPVPADSVPGELPELAEPVDSLQSSDRVVPELPVLFVPVPVDRDPERLPDVREWVRFVAVPDPPVPGPYSGSVAVEPVSESLAWRPSRAPPDPASEFRPGRVIVGSPSRCWET